MLLERRLPRISVTVTRANNAQDHSSSSLLEQLELLPELDQEGSGSRPRHGHGTYKAIWQPRHAGKLVLTVWEPVLRDMDGNVHYVPNGSITVASNFTQQFAVVVADVGVAYDTDINRVIEVLTDEAIRFSVDPEFAEHFLEAPQVLGVQTLGDWAVTVRVTLTVLADSRWIIKREFNRRVKVRLDAEGIEIPFPYRTIVQKNA